MPPSALELREARPEDLATVRTLTLAAYQQYAEIMSPGAWAALSDVVRRTLADPDPAATRIVAEQNRQLLGSVLLYPPATDAYRGLTGSLEWPEVRLLAVDPRARGQGIGRALMDECVRRAGAMGADWIGLHTSASLRVAIAMYERMGFERVPEHDFQPPGAEPVTAYRLRLYPGTTNP